jgi:hypothetical protein
MERFQNQKILPMFGFAPQQKICGTTSLVSERAGGGSPLDVPE